CFLAKPHRGRKPCDLRRDYWQVRTARPVIIHLPGKASAQMQSGQLSKPARSAFSCPPRQKPGWIKRPRMRPGTCQLFHHWEQVVEAFLCVAVEHAGVFLVKERVLDAG